MCSVAKKHVDVMFQAQIVKLRGVVRTSETSIHQRYISYIYGAEKQKGKSFRQGGISLS